MATASKDRLLALVESSSLNGIDFVELVDGSPLELRLHFVNAVTVDPITNITIAGGERIPTVTVESVAAGDWSRDGDGRPLLTLHVDAKGDFSDYTLTLESAALDPYFSHTQFSFEALCPSQFDCAPTPAYCPPPSGERPPIDYLAKDFLSFRQALLDFSALRYPEWQERSEADFGVMFLEALSGVADDLSYHQDRIAAEATLETATQRRSVVRHARMVDYEPRPATSAQVLLMCQVTSGPLPAGVPVRAVNPDGSPVVFEIGLGITDPSSYVVDARWNYPIAPYWWDDSARCLMRGATEMWLTGRGLGFQPGQALLIDTQGPNTADPPIREIIHITEVEEATDALFGATAVTRIAWSNSEGLAFDHDLTRTQVGGNLVPATQGLRYSENFAIDPAPSPAALPAAIARQGANSSAQAPLWDYLYGLRVAPLGWLPQADPEAAPLPEIVVRQTKPNDQAWSYAQRLINADEFEPAYAIEAGSYRAVAKRSGGVDHMDYDHDRAEVVRFGNGVFGVKPEPGDTFSVTYRTGAGAAGNVAADSITQVDPAWNGLLVSATNPFAATGGADAETNEQVRRFAPQAFRARQYRAVLASDYEAEAERLPWVQQAGTAFRWTGSWLTVFTTVDPKGVEALAPDRQVELIDLLNRRRLAGYESYVPPARYVSIDLAITFCVKPDAFRGEVAQAVLNALGNSSRPTGSTGFFFADHFTFGTPLERSRLEAAIQSVPGVAGVLSIQYRRRGVVPAFVDLPEVYELATDEILRLDNDPSFPEHGAFQIIPEGGK